ncbi:MAG: hypothetical protein VX589_20185, partial [Myxococcota bacterium]|nr:hypothetical protein [Myxococcota bacterium]
MGPDLVRALVGCEDKVGLLMHVQLGVWPAPRHHTRIGLEVSSPSDGVECMRRIRDRGIRPSVWAVWWSDTTWRLTCHFETRFEHRAWTSWCCEQWPDCMVDAHIDRVFLSRWRSTNQPKPIPKTYFTWLARAQLATQLERTDIIWDIDHEAVLLATSKAPSIVSAWSDITDAFYAAITRSEVHP